VVALLAGRATAPGLPVASYQPPAEVPRHAPAAVDVADLGRVSAFDLVGDRLYVLDAPSHRVLILHANGSGWRLLGSFGRRGGGPGELEAPYGLAVSGDGATAAVTDGGRVHFFSGAGEYRRSAALATSCPVLRPEIAAGAHGFYVAGTCRVGTPPDTFMAVLHHTVDGAAYTQVARDVRLTRDGRIGSYLNDALFSAGDGHHLFGAGSSACVERVTEPGGVPVAARQCGLVESLYRARPDPSTEARLRRERSRRPGYAAAFTWPRQLPVYRDHLVTPAGDVMLRQFSADSVVLRLHGSERDLLVASLDGFVGCRRGACLWAWATLHGMQLALLTADAVAELISGTEERQ
jgi:hypothetical protein